MKSHIRWCSAGVLLKNGKIRLNTSFWYLFEPIYSPCPVIFWQTGDLNRELQGKIAVFRPNTAINNNTPLEQHPTMRADQGLRLADEGFALLARSGLRRVLIGVESGSQEMLDWMQKDITLDQVAYCAEQCVRHGIGAIFPFIVGFPGETDESVQASLDLAKGLRAMSPQFETPLFYFKPYPGSAITAAVVREGYRLPQTLDDWADFDFVGSSGPWVNPEKHEFIERFKFYNRVAWGRRTWVRWPLQRLARWRCKRDFYGLPLEKRLVERLRPMPRLS